MDGEMAKRKYPSELNTRQIRVNVGDWLWLKELSQRLGITIAEAFHKALESPDHKAPVHPAQIPMPVTTARLIPVTMAEAMPVTSARVRSTPVTTSFSREVESVTNGHR